jgi:hypothetical protein
LKEALFAILKDTERKVLAVAEEGFEMSTGKAFITF